MFGGEKVKNWSIPFLFIKPKMVLCELRENSKVLMCFRVTLENVGLGSMYYVRMCWGFLEPPTPLRKDIFIKYIK